MRGAMFLLVLAGCGGKIDTSPTGTTTAGPSPRPTATVAPDDPLAKNQVVTATAYAGGLDHLILYAADPVGDSCITMHLTRPQTARTFESVAVPKGWGVASAERSPSAKRCGPGRQPPAAETAIDGQGVIDFDAASSTLPCTLRSVKVTLVFEDRPTTDLVYGDGVTVDGCQ